MARSRQWYDDDSEQVASSVARARQVKTQLQRCALYSSGSRARLPRVKYLQKPDPSLPQSPFTLQGFFDENEQSGKQFVTSVPPGAHEDNYRVLQGRTRSGQCTAEQQYWTTTSMTEGLRVMPQPPWYYGYSNKVKPSDTSILHSASRYGYRGSQQIRQFTRSPCALPEHTLTDRTPQFLREETLQRDPLMDAWVPALEARSSAYRQTQLNSPKLWPETAEYVSGYKQKRPSTSVFYHRETTAGQTEFENNQPDMRLTRTLSLLDNERDNLSASVHLEASRTLLSRPHTMAHMFWNMTSQQTLSTTIPTQSSLKRTRPPTSPVRIPNDSEKLRYSGVHTILVQNKTLDQMKAEYDVAQNKSALPLKMRWKSVFTTYHAIVLATKRERQAHHHVRELAEVFRAEAVKKSVLTLLNKAQFVRGMGKSRLSKCLTTKQINMLFSVFDVSKRNIIRHVELLAMLSVLEHPKHTTEEALAELWYLFEEYGRDQSPLENAQTIMLTCCGNDQERDVALRSFQRLRNSFYKLIAVAGHEPHEPPTSTSNNQTTRVNQRDTGAPSAYNLCDGKLSFDVLMRALRSEPNCLQLFENARRCRISEYEQHVLETSNK